MSAVREPRGRRAPFRRTNLTVVALLAALTASLLPATPSAEATATDIAQIDVLAAPGASGTVLEGQPLTVRVTLSNTGSRSTGELSIELRLDGARSATADELSEWFDGDSASESPALDDGLVAAHASVAPIEPGASAVLDVTVAAGSPQWGGPFGARLAEVTVADGSDWLAIDRTAVVRVPTGTTPPATPTTFVVPLTIPADTGPLLTAETLEIATAESGALTRALSASAGRPVLLAVDPRIVGSIRALGNEAPASALGFLERLAAAPNESILLPWADADPLASLDAAQQLLPLPEGAGRLIDDSVGEDPNATAAPTDEPTDDPTGNPDDEEPSSTTTPIADLIDFVPSLAATLWLERSGLSSESLAALSVDGTRLALTPSSALQSDDAVQRHGDMVLVRTDEALATAARAAASAPSQLLFDRSMARVSAILATAAATGSGTPAIITMGREVQTGGDRLLDTIAQTMSLNWSTGSTVSSTAQRSATPAIIVDAPADDTRRALVSAALAAEAADRQFSQIALAPAFISDGRRLELLAALSLGWGSNSVDALQGFVADSELLRSSVQVAESSAILLLTDRATLPVTVQNNLDVAVRVFVRVEPDTAQLRVLEPNVETVVEPQSQARTLVPVESLTNGEVDITVTVRDAQSRVLSEPTRVSLNLQAGWETAGTIVVAIAVVVLLVVGIWRDLRKRRRRAAGAHEPTPLDGEERSSA